MMALRWLVCVLSNPINTQIFLENLVSTLTYTQASFCPTLPQLNWQRKPLAFRRVSAHADGNLSSHFLPAPLPCVWPTCSGVRGQAPEIRDTEEKARDRELPFSSLHPLFIPLYPSSLSLFLHWISLWVTKAGQGRRRPPLHMSVRGMTDRAEIPAHRLLHRHHSNKPERAREGWMDGGKEGEMTQWNALYLKGRTR